MLLISKDWDNLFLRRVQCNGLGYVLLLLLLGNYYYTVYVTRFWKMGLIAHYAILSYRLPKSTQVYLAKIEFLL